MRSCVDCKAPTLKANNSKRCDECATEIRRKRKRLESLKHRVPDAERAIRARLRRVRAQLNTSAVAARKRAYRQRPDVKAQEAERCRAWRQANADRVKAVREAWRVANAERLKEYERNRERPDLRERKQRRRAREAAAPGSGVTDFAIWSTAWGNVCAYCCQPAKLEVDHIVPLSRGGSHHLENLAPSCRACNARKSAKILPICGELQRLATAVAAMLDER